MKIGDCLLVIGEITMEKRFLEDQNEILEKKVKTLEEELAAERAGKKWKH